MKRFGRKVDELALTAAMLMSMGSAAAAGSPVTVVLDGAVM